MNDTAREVQTNTHERSRRQVNHHCLPLAYAEFSGSPSSRVRRTLKAIRRIYGNQIIELRKVGGQQLGSREGE